MTGYNAGHDFRCLNAAIGRALARKIFTPEVASYSYRLDGFFRRRSGGFGLFGELRESGRILHRDVCQNLAVDGNARGFQPVNQLAVSDAVQASGGAHALDPQAAILPLLHAAVALRVTIRAIGRFLSRLVQLALCEEKAFCPLEILLTPSPAFCAAFYAWHGFSPSFLV